MAGGQQHVAAVLQQGVHGHDEEAGQAAGDQQQQVDAPGGIDQRHQQHHQAHGRAHRQHRQRAAQRNAAGQDRAHHGAQRRHAHQDGGLVQLVAQVAAAPFDDDQLQRGAGAPEQGRDGQRDLAQLVAPQHADIAPEGAHEPDRVLLLRRVAHVRLRNHQVAQGRQQVDEGDHQDGRLGWRMHQLADEGMVQQGVGHVRRDQQAAQHGAQDDGQHRQALDPAVALDQHGRRQHFGDDAVLGRRVGGGADADHAIGRAHQIRLVFRGDAQAGVREHQQTAGDLQGIGAEHHPALGEGVREGADEGGQHHVGQGEGPFHHGRQPVRPVQFLYQGDRRDEQRVVRQ